MKVRAVLFDAVGTLIYPRPGVVQVYHQVGRRFGCRLTPDQIERRFYRALRLDRKAGRDARAGTDERRERERWRGIVQGVLGDGRCGVEAAFESLWHHFARSESWRLDDDAVAALSRLMGRGLTIGVASNFDARLVSVLSGLGLLSDVGAKGGEGATPEDLSGALSTQTVFYSSALGFAKPHKEFFRAIERRLAIPSDSILLVGDDWRNDHLAALSAGWQSVYLDRSGGPTPHDSPVIGGLKEVLNHV